MNIWRTESSPRGAETDKRNYILSVYVMLCEQADVGWGGRKVGGVFCATQRVVGFRKAASAALHKQAKFYWITLNQISE